jgi:hypothetical protein
VPFAFVLDELERFHPTTRPMFGCTAVYVGEKIVLVLRERPTSRRDNGVWVATVGEHHESLSKELPSLRGIEVLGAQSSGWRIVPADSASFEDEVLHVCELVLARDPRIGKVPKARRPRGTSKGEKGSSEPPRRSGSGRRGRPRAR